MLFEYPGFLFTVSKHDLAGRFRKGFLNADLRLGLLLNRKLRKDIRWSPLNRFRGSGGFRLCLHGMHQRFRTRLDLWRLRTGVLRLNGSGEDNRKTCQQTGQCDEGEGECQPRAEADRTSVRRRENPLSAASETAVSFKLRLDRNAETTCSS